MGGWKCSHALQAGLQAGARLLPSASPYENDTAAAWLLRGSGRCDFEPRLRFALSYSSSVSANASTESSRLVSYWQVRRCRAAAQCLYSLDGWRWQCGGAATNAGVERRTEGPEECAENPLGKSPVRGELAKFPKRHSIPDGERQQRGQCLARFGRPFARCCC